MRGWMEKENEMIACCSSIMNKSDQDPEDTVLRIILRKE